MEKIEPMPLAATKRALPKVDETAAEVRACVAISQTSEKQPASTHDEEPQLVSHGYENIRFWRLRRGKLHCCGLPLQHEGGVLFLCLVRRRGWNLMRRVGGGV